MQILIIYLVTTTYAKLIQKRRTKLINFFKKLKLTIQQQKKAYCKQTFEAKVTTQELKKI